MCPAGCPLLNFSELVTFSDIIQHELQVKKMLSGVQLNRPDGWLHKKCISFGSVKKKKRHLFISWSAVKQCGSTLQGAQTIVCLSSTESQIFYLYSVTIFTKQLWMVPKKGCSCSYPIGSSKTTQHKTTLHLSVICNKQKLIIEKRE